MPPKVAIVAALEREVAPLTSKFTRRVRPGQPFAVFESGDVRLVCGGIGGSHAASATRWLIAEAKPEVVMSIGFAGGLVPDRHVGDVIAPAAVIDANTGAAFPTMEGKGVVVTAGGVLAQVEKQSLAAQYQAEAVDMEAAAVARVAQENGIPFLAVKAISDELGFAMPPLQPFVQDGEVRTSKLLAYAAVRPSLWPVLMRLGRNAKTASSQLCRWMENHISRDFHDISAVYGKAGT